MDTPALLERFEHQVNALLLHFDRLKKENKILREKQAHTFTDQSTLVGNQQKITSTLERLIGRLKLIASE